MSGGGREVSTSRVLEISRYGCLFHFWYVLTRAFPWSTVRGATLAVPIPPPRVNVQPSIIARHSSHAGPLIVHARLSIVVVVICLVAHFASAQSHRHPSSDHVRVAVARSFGQTMMPDLASDAQASATHTATCACSALGHIPGDLSCRSYLCSFVLRRQSRIFVLCSIAPYSSLLFPHQRYVAARCGRSARTRGGVSTESGGNVGWCALGHISRDRSRCCRL